MCVCDLFFLLTMKFVALFSIFLFLVNFDGIEGRTLKFVQALWRHKFLEIRKNRYKVKNIDSDIYKCIVCCFIYVTIDILNFMTILSYFQCFYMVIG